MSDICIPIPNLKGEQIAEVEIRVNGRKRTFNYRVESFDWMTSPPATESPLSETSDRIDLLRNQIEGYDHDWELIQIYNPRPADKFIHVLFRQRAR